MSKKFIIFEANNDHTKNTVNIFKLCFKYYLCEVC